MSFIKNLFQKGDNTASKTEAKKAADAREILEKEKAREKLEQCLGKTDLQLERLYEEIAELETLVKSHIKLKQKDKAMMVLKKLKAKKGTYTRLQKNMNFLSKQATFMESNFNDDDLLDTMKTLNRANSNTRQMQENLANEVTLAKELAQEATMNRQALDDLLDDDDDKEEIDAMMEKYESQIAEDLKANFQQADKKLATPGTGKSQKSRPVPKPVSDLDDLIEELMA